MSITVRVQFVGLVPSRDEMLLLFPAAPSPGDRVLLDDGNERTLLVRRTDWLVHERGVDLIAVVGPVPVVQRPDPLVKEKPAP